MTTWSGQPPMDLGQNLFSEMSSGSLERRSALRIALPFPAIIRGIDAEGLSFEEQGHLDNLSAAGLYVQLHHRLDRGAMVFVAIRITLDEAHTEQAAGVAIKGVVLRVDAQDDNCWGYAVLFVRHRFLFVDRK